MMFLNTLAVFKKDVVKFNMLLTVQLEDGIKDSCYENFVTFAEKSP